MTNNKYHIIIFIIAFMALPSLAKVSPTTKHKIGFNVGASTENYPLRYVYQTNMYQVQWNYTFARVSGFEFESILSPQISTTYYNEGYYPYPGFSRGIELGFTVGVNCRFNFWKDRLFVCAMGIIGPMYTPSMPPRQGTPLNFSDNLAVGIGARIAGHYIIDLRIGYRHLSNAELNPPNHGINSHWISGGVYYCF